MPAARASPGGISEALLEDGAILKGYTDDYCTMLHCSGSQTAYMQQYVPTTVVPTDVLEARASRITG